MPGLNQALISELVVGGSVDSWRRIGINFDSHCRARLGDTALHVDVSLAPGFHSLQLLNADASATSIDGVPITHTHIASKVGECPSPGFDLGVIGVDHVVVNTADLLRTSAALTAATGATLLRVRDAGNSVEQGFHRLGSVLIEIVGDPRSAHDCATLWGFVINVRDIHGAADFLGPDVLSIPKPAVQRGRFIATFRSSVGLGVPLALMTPSLT